MREELKPQVTVIDQKHYHNIPWKNGLGKTIGIAIHPKQDFLCDSFVWRLSLSEARDNCSFAVLPGYDVALLLLPEKEKNSRPLHSLQSPAVLHHNDQETFVPFKPLVPYTYNGEWPTTCRVRQRQEHPLKYLMFHVNRKLADVSVALETICPLGGSDEGICDGDGDEDQRKPISKIIANPTTKILLGNFTIIFVVKGSIKVQIENQSHACEIEAGQTLVIERHEEAEPTDLAMTPLSSTTDMNDMTEKLSLVERITKEHRRSRTVSADLMRCTEQEDATVVIIQVNLKHNRESTSCWDLPGGISARQRAGSIIVYDDQPLWTTAESRNGSTAELSSTSESCNLSTKYWESAKHYKPPVFSARFVNESDVPPPIVRDTLIIEEFPVGQISTAWINIMKQGLSEWLRVPVIVARGKGDGPVVGITAVVHGNELNGVPCIHRVITDIDVNHLKGTVVAVPCVNVPGYLRFSREFSDGKDLNRLFPGQESGTASQLYAYNILSKIVEQFNILIDLHTASFGRVNSYYVRSDMNDPDCSVLAKLQQPQIILHNSGQDGTLRSAAMSRGIKAITVEIGNPQLFQNQYVQWSYLGVMSILAYLNMFSPVQPAKSDNTEHRSHLPFTLSPAPSTVLCSKGFWIYTRTGGVLEVYPNVNTFVRKGALIARIKNIFGNIVDEIFCPAAGITIGRSSNPVAMAGDRVLHLGIIKKENEVLPKDAKENY